jgi:hypothetical protein
MKELPKSDYSKITKSLVDFGYPGMTDTIVKESADKLLAGGKKENIVDMFVFDILKKNGVLR